MNPFAVPNPLSPLHPANQASFDARPTTGDLDPLVSRTAYRLINTIGQVLVKHGR